MSPRLSATLIGAMLITAGIAAAALAMATWPRAKAPTQAEHEALALGIAMPRSPTPAVAPCLMAGLALVSGALGFVCLGYADQLRGASDDFAAAPPPRRDTSDPDRPPPDPPFDPADDDSDPALTDALAESDHFLAIPKDKDFDALFDQER